MTLIIDDEHGRISTILKLVLHDQIFIHTNARIEKKEEWLTWTANPLIALHATMVSGCALVAVSNSIASAYWFEGSSALIKCVDAGFVFAGRNDLSLEEIAPRKKK